ncbi:MAG TPA: Fe-S protein assembly co-chaperone HscB [Solibacterales bacterium]|nr:Fe-S protein assembly co-chaperone HscB [Bryobacterales bacterium]
MEHHDCWQCGHPSAQSLFCQFCNTLQPPVPDYYRFLGMPKKLHLDTSELQKRFYQMSRLLHPDRFTRATNREQQLSLDATAILNDAYRVLRDPVARAEYVLKESGLDNGEQRTKDVPPELLEEVFELNMALEELRMGDRGAREPLEESHRKFLGMRDAIDGELFGLFARYDGAGDAESGKRVLAEIRGVLNRRRYIRNLVEQVEKELAA